jgi:rhodanese-related sulfurtransferase
MPGPITAVAAKAVLHGKDEVACLDVREHGQYGEGHPFLAVPCPYSRLEILAPALLPRASVPVILVDDGDGVAERAAAALAGLGYRDVAWIEGGAAAWAQAGFTLFKGVNLPSKTLGELLEAEWHVPRIDVETLDAWQREERAFHLFDGRPASEYRKMTIPDAASMPNGELAHRFSVADPAEPVVIHCAGRTRSIVGAASLALAGVPNPVFALENGTQGWALSGRALHHGATPAPLPDLSEDARLRSRDRADAVIAANRLTVIRPGDLDRLAADPARTLYVLDVRTEAEFAAGTLTGAVHAPAVQLVQASDAWLGVRRARVVLGCDTGLRSATAAVFLAALNYEVFVLPGIETFSGHSGPGRRDAPTPPTLPALEPMSVEAAVALAAAGETLLDLRGSLDFRAGHLAGARWAIRPRLGGLDPARPVALVGTAEVVALAARDLRAAGHADIRHVAGDPAVWRASGLAVEAMSDDPPDATAIDHLFFVHDRHDGNLDAARRYLAWEMGLVAQLDPAERAEYRIGPSPFANPSKGCQAKAL